MSLRNSFPLLLRQAKEISWNVVLAVAIGLSGVGMVVAQGVMPEQSVTPDSGAAIVKLAEASFFRQTALPAWARPLRTPPPSQRNDAFVVRMTQTQMWSGSKPAYLSHRVIQANQSSALAQIGQMQIEFVPHYQRVTLHALSVQRENEVSDRLHSVAVRFIDSEPGLSHGIYSGTVVANLLLDDVRVGDSVTITYSVEGANPVFRDGYAEYASWDRSEQNDWRVVELIAPTSQPFDWRMVGPDKRRNGALPLAVKPTLTTVGDNSVATFEQRNVPAVEDEAQLPADYASHRFLQVSRYRSWAEVARWADELFPVTTDLPEEMTAVLANIRQLPSEEARVAAVLRWVQAEVRYFSVSFGESSHRPYVPKEVIARRYGDCKDKSYLLVTLLRALGIEARPILVSLQSPRAVGLTLPSPSFFDHVIVQVRLGERLYYIDGTLLPQDDVPLAKLSSPIPGALGLPADARAEALIELPLTPPELNASELNERITIKQFDVAPTLDSSLTLNGVIAEVFRITWPQSTPDQRRQVASAAYEKRYPGMQIIGEPELKDDRAANRIVLHTRMTLPKAVREQGGDRAITYLANNFGGFFQIPENARRLSPAVVAVFPNNARYRVTVEWPDNVSSLLDPVLAKVDNEFFRGEVERTFRGNTFTMSASVATKIDVVEARQLTKLREEVRKFENSLGAMSYVPAANVQGRGILGFGKNSLQQRLQKNYERRIEGASLAIKGDKLAGEDLAEAYCERGIARSALGEIETALADGDAAVKLGSAIGSIHYCRAELRFNVGVFEGSISDFSRALVLGVAPADAYYRRGHSRFYAGQYDAAAVDFTRAAEAKFTADGAGAAHYAQLWQIWALQRAGQPIPEALVAQAKREADGGWPRSALAMMVGARTPEQVLAEVNALSGDEREMNLSEAYFYIGQYWLGRGDQAAAQRAFEASRGKEILMYIEHIAAGHELKRMAAQTPR